MNDHDNEIHQQFEKTAIDEGAAMFGAGRGIEYTQNVQQAVDKLTQDLIKNAQQNTAKNSKILGGDLAEFWHADTFNIDAVIKQKSVGADIPRVNTLGSADVVLATGEDVQLKYYATAQQSVNKQRTSYLAHYKQQHHGSVEGFDNWFKENAPKGASADTIIYPEDMIKLIPSDQLQDAKSYLVKKIRLYDANGESAQAEATRGVLKNLDSKIKKDGVSSSDLSKQDSTDLATDAKKGKFDPEEYGLDEKSLLRNNQMYVLKQALKTGVSAATVAAVISLLPTFFQGVQSLMNNEGLSFEDLSVGGGVAINNSADAFFQATITSYLTTDAAAGLFGERLTQESFKDVLPAGIGSLVVLTYGACKTYIQYSIGKLTAVEAKQKVNSLLFSTMFSFGGGALMIGLGPIGMTIGSIVGSVIGGMVYGGIEHLALSYAMKNGTTIFGLVDQDYTMTDDMLELMGLERFSMDHLSFETLEMGSFELETFPMAHFSFDHMETGMLRRGVVGINKIGYLQS